MSFSWFDYKLIKYLYMGPIIVHLKKVYVLFILFPIYDSKAGLFEGNLFWVGQSDPQPSY